MLVPFALARVGARRCLAPLAGLVVVVALGIGVVHASLEAAARTEDAYPAYLNRSEVGELIINPTLVTDRLDSILATVPGISGYAGDSLLTATLDDGHPRPQVEVESDYTQVRVSTEGRYTRQDRPVVHQGRMIRDGAEAFVSVESAETLGVQVGDTLPLAFWEPSFNGPGDRPDLTRPIETIGRTEARVVGIGVFADEVLVDELYPRTRILVTPDVGARFDCTLAHPDPDDTRTLDELAVALFPRGCALAVRFYSLQVEGGEEGVPAVIEAMTQRFEQENARLPAAMQEFDVGFFVNAATTAADRARLERSLNPAVTALRAFGLAVAIATLVLALTIAFRVARSRHEESRRWRALGITRMQRLIGIAAPLITAVLVGLALSVVIGGLGSGLGPVASARAVEPHAGMGLSADLVLAVLGGSVGVLLAGVVLAAAAAASGRPARARRSAAGLSRTIVRSTRPPVLLGLRAAVGGQGAAAVLAASVTAVTAVAAAVVFSTSLDRLVSDPERFGWPYDAAAMVNAGFGQANVDAIAGTLDRPDVEAWGLGAVSGDLEIDGVSLPFVAARAGFETVGPPVISGAAPRGSDEIALGARTAAALNLTVGDAATVATSYGERRGVVTGLVVLPAIGPLEADRTSLGDGVLLPAPFFEAMLAETEREAGYGPGELADSLASFVAIDLRDGVSGDELFAEISDSLPTWDLNRIGPSLYPEPVRPAPIADVSTMRSVPAVLAGLFALTMACGLVLGIAVATRARRFELAVLRTLGGSGRQLRSSVRWHALAVVGVGLIAGVPLGTALGRAGFRAFADTIGASPEPFVSLPWMAVAVLAVVAIGLLAAVDPGRRASRIVVAEALRREEGIADTGPTR